MTCYNMKSNTEVYAEWLESKETLDPCIPLRSARHPPTTTMSTDTPTNNDNIFLCQLQNKISDLGRFNNAATRELSAVLQNIEESIQEKNDEIKDLKDQIEELKLSKGYEDDEVKTEDLENIPAVEFNNPDNSVDAVGELTPDQEVEFHPCETVAQAPNLPNIMEASFTPKEFNKWLQNDAAA